MWNGFQFNFVSFYSFLIPEKTPTVQNIRNIADKWI